MHHIAQRVHVFAKVKHHGCGEHGGSDRFIEQLFNTLGAQPSAVNKFAKSGDGKWSKCRGLPRVLAKVPYRCGDQIGNPAQTVATTFKSQASALNS